MFERKFFTPDKIKLVLDSKESFYYNRPYMAACLCFH